MLTLVLSPLIPGTLGHNNHRQPRHFKHHFQFIIQNTSIKNVPIATDEKAGLVNAAEKETNVYYSLILGPEWKL